MLLFSEKIQASSLNSLSITKATLKAAINSNNKCLNYKITMHVCVWLSPFSGRNLTPVLDHYLPDLVVTVFRNNDENPWFEVNKTIDKISSFAQQRVIKNVGSGNTSFLDEHEQHIIFKEADVIGNPALLVFKGHGLPLLLESTAQPMRPYYQSMLDSALWRGMMPGAAIEELYSVGAGFTHRVGTNLTDWGGVYPHEGSVVANNDAKGSMVIAQRASDLVTNTMSFGHVKKSLSNSCGEHCDASIIKENNDDTLFQLIYPIEEDKCVVFGEDESYREKMLNKEGAYVWVVWRHYKGCLDGDGIFLGVV